MATRMPKTKKLDVYSFLLPLIRIPFNFPLYDTAKHESKSMACAKGYRKVVTAQGTKM